MKTNPVREKLYQALLAIMNLEQGLALDCSPITDPAQIYHLLLAKRNIQEAMDMNPRTGRKRK